MLSYELYVEDLICFKNLAQIMLERLVAYLIVPFMLVTFYYKKCIPNDTSLHLERWIVKRAELILLLASRCGQNLFETV